MATERDEYEFIARFRAEALDAAKQAEDMLRAIGGAADDIPEPMDDAADSMEHAIAAAAALGTAVASAFVAFSSARSALSAFAEFEVSMLAIAKVSDLTNEELDAMGKAFEELAAKAGLPVEDFLKVGEVAGQLGISGAANIREFASAMVDLGGASNITAEEGANAIARMLNVTKESITEARAIASVLVDLGNVSAATEKEIVDRAQEIALATAAFGTNSTEALAMGAAMAELGLRAETSGTAVGRVFIAMSEAAVKGGAELDAFAAAVQMTAQEFKALQTADPTALFYRLLETLSNKDQNTIIKTLSDLNLMNAENAKTLVPLITGYDRLREVRERAYAERKAPKALDQEAARAQEALAREFAGLLQMIDTEVRELGEALAPVAQMLIDFAKTAIEWFNLLPEPVQSAIKVVALLTPTLLAAAMAVKGLALAFGLLVPAGVSAAAMGGATAAAMMGLGTAGQFAGAGLAVARYALGALLGPIGLVLAVGGTLAYMFWDTGDAADSMESTLATADNALREFAEASKRAKEEQIGLREGVSETTEKMLEQSRAAMQRSKEELEKVVSGFLDTGIDGDFATKVRGELSGVMEALEELARAEPFNDVLGDVAGVLADLKSGKIGIDEARDALNRFIGVGDEALELVVAYRNAWDSGNEGNIKASTYAMLEYARSVGGFGEELEFIDRMLAQGDFEAANMAISELAAELEYSAEAGDKLRELLSPALLDAIMNAADAEVRVAAFNAALAGNHELAQLILDTGNPWAKLEDGADAAAEAVRGLGTAILKAFGLYNKMGSFDPKWTDRGAWARGAATAAERGMLDLIGYAEGTDKGRGYNETLGYGAFTGGDVNLINMTLLEVLELQKAMLAHPDNTYNSSAVGRYQIVSTTLEGLIKTLGLTGQEQFTPALQDRMALELLRGRSGQGVEGLRNEWEGLRYVDPNTINAAMSGQVIPTMDPEVAREQERLGKERQKQLEDEAEARKDLLSAQEESIAAAEFELSLIGKSTYEQARLRAEFDLLTQAKRDGIDVDKELTASGKTYREEIEATARALAENAVAQERAQKKAEQAAKAQEFYNQQQEVFQQGVIDAIMEGNSLVEVLGQVAKAFARAALEAALFGSGPFGTGGGFLSGLFGLLTGGIMKVGTASAQGNVFRAAMDGASAVIAFAQGGAPALTEYRNQIVGQPTLFPMAGGQVGLMGEDGEEAIMPLMGGKVRAIVDGQEVLLNLTRTGDGDLGVIIPPEFTPFAKGGVPDSAVSMAGQDAVSSGANNPSAPGAGGMHVNYSPTYNITVDGAGKVGVQSSDSGMTSKDQEKMLAAMDSMLRQKMIEFLTREMQNGGMLRPAAKPYG